MSEINITPFVDIILVLLIVFMISAPLLTSGVTIDLPQSKSQPLAAKETPLTISLRKDGTLFFGEDELKSVSELAERLRAAAQVTGSRERQVFIRADRQLRYESVITVLEEVTTAGFSAISLVTEPRRR